MADRIELADLVTSLRSEINRAWSQGQYDVVGFEAGRVEVELATEVELVEVQGRVTAKFWVLEVGAEAGRTRTTTQRVTFSLTPRDRRGPSRPLLDLGHCRPEGASPGPPRGRVIPEDRQGWDRGLLAV